MSQVPIEVMAKYTTMQVGGKPKSLTKCESTKELYETVLKAWNEESNYQILAGGSNTVFADEISNLDVILVANLGKEIVSESETSVTVRVQAGEGWDEFVAWAVEHGYAGIEAMSGIPGSV